MNKFTNQHWNSFVDLLFPRECLGCHENLQIDELEICTNCLLDLPISYHFNLKENPVYKTFKGRIEIEGAYSFLNFKPENIAQKILHELKYSSNIEVGYKLGKLFGQYFKLQKTHPIPDVVIPVPLHPNKLKKRGFNQAEILAKTFCEEIGSELAANAIKRNVENDTQTNKNRMDRWQNVSSIFSPSSEYNFSDKHYLIFDDVITTGATIESCASVIKELNCNPKVSIASIAFTN